MKSNLEIEEVLFSEYSSKLFKDENHSVFDVYYSNDASNSEYCQALILKMLEIKINDVFNFIYHHVQLVENKFLWLEEVERLIAKNERVFRKTKNLPKMVKLYTAIESKRFKLNLLSPIKLNDRPEPRFINAESSDRYFSFCQTIKKLDEIKDYCEQLLFLTQEKHEYEQADLEFENKKLENFAIQCQKKIEHLKHIRELKNELLKENLTANQQQLPFNKLKFNGNINQLVDVFYQLSRELFVPNIHHNYIDGNVNDLVKMIHNTFVDKDGNDLSMETIKTLLTPSKEDKRPSLNKRIDVEAILDKNNFPT